MKSLTKIAVGLMISGALVASNSSMAASDGTLGTDSTGQSVVSLEVQNRVQISDVEDIALGAYSGTGTMVGEVEYCVYRNGADNYKVTLTTSQAAFQIQSATTTDTIAFSVKVDDDLDAGAGGEALSYNTASAVALAGSAQADCGGSDNGAIEVTFAEAALQAVGSANDYQATMTVLVEPI